MNTATKTFAEHGQEYNRAKAIAEAYAKVREHSDKGLTIKRLEERGLRLIETGIPGPVHAKFGFATSPIGEFILDEGTWLKIVHADEAPVAVVESLDIDHDALIAKLAADKLADAPVPAEVAQEPEKDCCGVCQENMLSFSEAMEYAASGRWVFRAEDPTMLISQLGGRYTMRMTHVPTIGPGEVVFEAEDFAAQDWCVL